MIEAESLRSEDWSATTVSGNLALRSERKQHLGLLVS